MTDDVERPRWLIVVRRERSELHAKLCRDFGRAAWVAVILDRRRGERRQPTAPPPELDWRQADRRRAPGERSLRAYRLAHEGEDFVVHEATSPLTARCTDCGLRMECEMPQFGEPPARLQVDVVHQPSPTTSGSQEVRHIVELEAFAPTGRRLMAVRIRAQPRRNPSA